MGIDERKYREITDKYMGMLLSLFARHDIDLEPEQLDLYGTILCDCVIESMRAQNRQYAYEVGVLHKFITAQGKTDVFWDMIAGFYTREEAAAYKMQLEADGKPAALFYNGTPIEMESQGARQ